MPGRVKCNYDDASHHDGNRISGLGWIIRDSRGMVLDCGMGQFQGRSSPEEAECTALLWAIQAASALGYTKVEFEGDNINVARLVNSNEANPRLKHYLESIWKWRTTFSEITCLNHESRTLVRIT